ncbi:MAG: DUF2442 domain-containing protein [Desulfococcaceae bacterium]
MAPAVTKVVTLSDFVLSISFENGDHGRLDMKNYLDFGVFQRLKSVDAFREVRVSFDTIEWSCGIDLDPEFIYEKCELLGKGSNGHSKKMDDSLSPNAPFI